MFKNVKCNILIVEDEILTANTLERMLQKNPLFHVVGIAVDYDQALQYLNSEVINLVLLDIHLFGLKTGLHIAEYLNQTAKIPFIFLTSYGDKENMQKMKSLLPAAFLAKPALEINLVTAIEIALANKPYNQPPICLTIGNNKYYIKTNDLLYAEAEHVYVRLQFKLETLLLRISLQRLLASLPEGVLIQINRSVAVNPTMINATSNKKISIGSNTFSISYKYLRSL